MLLNIKRFLYQYPFLSYLLLAAVVFWPLSLGIYSLQFDAIDVLLPWRFYGSESIRQGIVPLWNPYQSGGYPFFADLQYAIWNPELFIVSLFSRYNVTIIQWLFVLYIAIGGLGFRFLLQQFKIETKVAFFGGILFMLSGMLLGHAQSMASVLGAVWLVWAIGSYIAALENNFSFKSTLRFILFTFLMLSSAYQAVSIILFYVFLVFFLYRLIELIKTKNSAQLKQFIIGHLISIIALGILMLGIITSLIDVFPHVERLGGLTLEDTQRYIMHPKAVISSVFPFASIHTSFEHMDISFQNIFNGTLIFFLLIYGLKNIKSYISPYLIILMGFGIVFGLASLGGFTPIQPFLAQFFPGLDLFYYAVFYRYFAWIPLLIIACFGLQHYLNKQNAKPFFYFLLSALLFYSISSIATLESFNNIWSISYSNLSKAFKSLSFNDAILLQSLFHTFIVLSFIALYFIIKQKTKLIFIFLVLELALISQFNIPITVHGETKTSTINDYLSLKKEGFSIPNNTVAIGNYSNFGKDAGIWRNQGNYTNQPNLNGFSSFILNNRANIKNNHPEIENSIANKPFAYLKDNQTPVTINHFSPNKFGFNVNALNSDTLIVQQANYPGWKATINGKSIPISTSNGFEMNIALQKGNSHVVFEFEKPFIQFLFYFLNVSFLLLLLLYFWISSPSSPLYFKSFVVLIILGFLIFKLINYQNQSLNQKGYTLTAENKPSLTAPSFLDVVEKEKVLTYILSPEISDLTLTTHNLDFNPELIALINYEYSNSTIPYLENEFLFSSDKTKTLHDTITVNHTNRFSNALQSGNLKEIHTHKTTLLTYGLTIHSKTIPDKLSVVIDIQRNGQSYYYKAQKVTRFTSNHTAYFMHGLLLPKTKKGDKVLVYLWNNSSEEFIFSNFKATFSPLK